MATQPGSSTDTEAAIQQFVHEKADHRMVYTPEVYDSFIEVSKPGSQRMTYIVMEKVEVEKLRTTSTTRSSIRMRPRPFFKPSPTLSVTFGAFHYPRIHLLGYLGPSYPSTRFSLTTAPTGLH